MLIITHDRYLANRIADRIIIMDGEGIRNFEGDWDAYKAFLEENTAPEKKEQTAPRNDYVLAKERKSAILKAKAALKRIEDQVHSEENNLHILEAKAYEPDIAGDYEAVQKIYEAIAQKRAQIEDCYTDWEQADAQLRALLGGEDE